MQKFFTHLPTIVIYSWLVAFFFTSNSGLQIAFPISKENFNIKNSQEEKGKCKAVVTHELYIMIDDMCAGDVNVLEADISELELKNQQIAEKFFELFDDPRVQFDVKFDENKVFIHLNDTNKKSLKDWQSYFKNKIAKQRADKGFLDFRKLISID